MAVPATTGAIAGMAAFVPIFAYAIGVLPMGRILLVGSRYRPSRMEPAYKCQAGRRAGTGYAGA